MLLQSSQLPLQEVPRPSALSRGPEQLIGFMVNDSIASTVYVPFDIELPDAPAGTIGPIDANDVLTVLHRLSYVEDELLQRSGLIGAFGAGEIRTVVLEGLDGGNHDSASTMVQER